jgi:thiol-disulfide isomerase/thioredoxin
MTLKRLGFWSIFALIIVVMGLIFSQAPNVAAQNPDVTIYYFWGDGCPVCDIATPYMQALADGDPRIQLESYEIWYDPAAQQVFFDMAAEIGFEPRYVPTTIIGARYWEGYTEAHSVRDRSPH